MRNDIDIYRNFPRTGALVGATGVLCIVIASHLDAYAETQSHADVEVLSSPAVSVSFRTAPNSPKVTGVDLWISTDRGATWKKHADNASPDRPLLFDAAADGEYGLYLILRNSAGGSAAPPTPGTAPQKTVLLDRQAPLVQILSARKDPDFAINREMHLRWTVQDENLPPRPVWLHFRTGETKAWRLICDGLEPESSYRWTVPEEASGRIEVKITAKDLAGNIGRSEIQWREIRCNEPAEQGFAPLPSEPTGPANLTALAAPVPRTPDPAAESVSIDPASRKRARQLHELDVACVSGECVNTYSDATDTTAYSPDSCDATVFDDAELRSVVAAWPALPEPVSYTHLTLPTIYSV